jgi:hypothetical protein
MAEHVLLHVGTHKTGSTSLQLFLRDHNDGLLARSGAHYPSGLLLPILHADLPLLAIRRERDWPARIRFPDTRDPAWLAAAEAHVREQHAASSRPTLVYSHEDLSYVRFDDEVDRLRELFGALTVRVVVYLREPAAFLRSYRQQLEAMGFPASNDRDSFAYVEPDSWLVDYDALVSVYRRGFGETNVEVIDYDDAVARDGSIIPSFTDLLGIARADLPPLDGYRLNQAGAHVRPTDEQLADIRRRLASRGRDR